MVRCTTFVGLVCAAVAPFLPGGAGRPQPVDEVVIGLAVGLAAAVALSFTRPPVTRVVAVVGAVAVLAATADLLADDLGSGLTAARLPVLAVGALAVAAGAAFAAGQRTRAPNTPGTSDSSDTPGTPRTSDSPQTPGSPETSDSSSGLGTPRTSDSAAAGARRGRWVRPRTPGPTEAGARRGPRVRVPDVVVAVGMAAAAVVAPDVARASVVDSQPRDERLAEPPPLVDRLTGRQWSWQPAADVVDVVAAGHGVVVGVNDGSVVALDGPDGNEQWRYARRDGKVASVTASPDRRAVVVSYRSRTDSRALLLVVLDAGTGVVRFEKVVPVALVDREGPVPGTRVLALRDHDAITAYDLLTGDEKWRWTAPGGCGSPYTRPARGKSTVFAAVECPDLLRVVALDEGTGVERWKHELATGPGDERQDVRLDATTDGAALSVRVFTSRSLPPGAVTSGVFDAETGAVLARPDRRWTVRTRTGPRVLLEVQDGATPTETHVLDLTSGESTPLDTAACAQRVADATTSGSYLRACDDTGRDLKIVTQDLAGGTPVTTPVRLDGSGASAKTALVAAPGAVVVTRTSLGGTPAPVVGLT
ncbi:outer membrane protein assembly factor BamB family protein [Saccharothrix obliqua]|uniref:outer membrane protein assembly factor BamB family protein n=1 Tax=Saccharothrix obliqua TaxID=2861747 RepID=UPI001C5E4C0F|nr:PQQ-binding-like beta-propeller repeat protein [Saccharothrix obliqua]MBW4718437.1 PQQ-like beta-propeller repeat protein [Saccharothrix obliqua]